MHIIRKIYKGLRVVFYRVACSYSWGITCFKFYLNGVKFSDFISYGIPVINVDLEGRFTIGKHFSFNSGKYFNMVGRQQPCYFIVAKNALLSIDENVGMSSTAIVCHNRISIGKNVKIGGNTVIYDTDFHSLDPKYRNSYPESLTGVRTRPVIIKDGAFIGAHCTILKGVTIGVNAIVGAGSVVNQSIPDGQIWIGNPARYIREGCKEIVEQILQA
jgi:acetyltransferase-like isoleucine patch superfamily enzyme